MQINLLYVLLIIAIALIGTIITLLYYIFVQKPEMKRELKINKKKILDFLQNTQINRIKIEQIAKILGIEEFTVRDILLDFVRKGKLPGLFVFPNIYFDFQYCKDVIHSLAEKQSINEIPFKLLAKELQTTKHNVVKILIELITNQKLQGLVNSKKDIFSIQKNKFKKKNLTCPFCNSDITPSTDTCPDCGAQIKKCGVCNLIIGNEKFVNCPFCGASSHSEHLFEWLKIKGTCPICKHKIHEELLKGEFD